MFVCRHCGYVSHSEDVDCCNNSRCRHYGRGDDDKVISQRCCKPDCAAKCESKFDCSSKTDCGKAFCKCDNKCDNRCENRCENKCNGGNNIQPFGSDDSCPGLREYNKTRCNPSYQERHFLKSSSCSGGGNNTHCNNCREDNPESNGCSSDNSNCSGDNCHKSCYEMPEVESCGMIGFATVPFQKYCDTYDLCKALRAGTIFKALDMPYTKKIIRRG